MKGSGFRVYEAPPTPRILSTAIVIFMTVLGILNTRGFCIRGRGSFEGYLNKSVNLLTPKPKPEEGPATSKTSELPALTWSSGFRGGLGFSLAPQAKHHAEREMLRQQHGSHMNCSLGLGD